jgi:hypothetical protein
VTQRPAPGRRGADPDERELLDDWMTRPADMYEVGRVARGSDLTLHSMTGGPQRIWQQDRMFSMSVRRLDIVVGRLLPDGDRLPDGGEYLRALGGLAILPRDLRKDVKPLFPDGPVPPGADPKFPVRLLSRFAQEPETVFQTGDGDEHRFCETAVDVRPADGVWERLTAPCVPPPEPPISDLSGYDAYLAALPPRFWVRGPGGEAEYVGNGIQPGRLTNLGMIRRRSGGFLVTANSERRAAHLEQVVLDAAAAAGQEAAVTARTSKTANEMTGMADEPDRKPDSREAMCRRLGATEALAPADPRVLILDEYFLPLERAVGEAIAGELNRELGIRSMLEAAEYEGLTPAAAVAAGGTARDHVLAMIDDCEWRLARTAARGQDTSFMPGPDELRRRLGLSPARTR